MERVIAPERFAVRRDEIEIEQQGFRRRLRPGRSSLHGRRVLHRHSAMALCPCRRPGAIRRPGRGGACRPTRAGRGHLALGFGRGSGSRRTGHYKAIIGPCLRARRLPGQQTERPSVSPSSIARSTRDARTPSAVQTEQPELSEKGQPRPSPDPCNNADRDPASAPPDIADLVRVLVKQGDEALDIRLNLPGHPLRKSGLQLCQGFYQ